MASNYRQFSEVLIFQGPTPAKEQADWVERVLYRTTWDSINDGSIGPEECKAKLVAALKAEGVELDSSTDLEYWPDFTYVIHNEQGPVGVWFYDGGGSDLNQIASFVQSYLKKFCPETTFAIQWADTCDKPRAGEFGGGVVYITATEVVSASTVTVLEEMRKGWRPGG